jgi:predicted Zn-dependent peptidase
MKRTIPLAAIAVLICAWAGEIPKHPRDLKYPALNFKPPHAADYRHKLASGATAYLVEDHELPLVHISVLVRTGEYLEPAGKQGLSQLTGSQIRSGGTVSKKPAEFDEEAAFLAAQISSGIGTLEGQASLDCLSKDIDAGLAMFIDMLRHPGFAEDRLQLARNQMLQGMERRNDSTTGIEAREWERLLRGDRFFTAVPTTKASVESITRKDLLDFHGKYYYPANFILAVSGDFQTKEMLSKLDKAFAGWDNRAGAVPRPPKPDFSPAGGAYIVDKKVNQGRVRMGHLGVTIANPDHQAITVMNGILGGNGFTSRITARVRSDEGLAYQAGSIFQHGYYYDGAFSVVFQSKSASVAQAVAIVREEIGKMRSSPVTKEELEIEKGSVVESFPRRFATASLRAAQFASDDYNGVPADYWDKYRDRVQALKAEDIHRVAEKYLHPDKLIVLVVGDAEAIEKGNPDKPEYKLGPATKIALPDPLTMVYPK